MSEKLLFEGKLEGIFDTHAHIYDDKYESQGLSAQDILVNARDAGISRILIPGDSVASSQKALEYVHEFSGKFGVELYSSCGVHPHEAKDYDSNASEYIIDCLSSVGDKVKALGEIGLDYHYDLSPRDVQREVFTKQLEIARELEVPIILHEREATGDCLEIIKKFFSRGSSKISGVCHCCSCSLEATKDLLSMGFFLGFDGPITYKNNKKSFEVISYCPLDRIVVETDSPYLTPEPNRGKINEPSMVPFVLATIAGIKNISLEDTCKITASNGCTLFGID